MARQTPDDPTEGEEGAPPPLSPFDPDPPPPSSSGLSPARPREGEDNGRDPVALGSRGGAGEAAEEKVDRMARSAGEKRSC